MKFNPIPITRPEWSVFQSLSTEGTFVGKQKIEVSKLRLVIGKG